MLTWDDVNERYYQTGVDRGVLYPTPNKLVYYWMTELRIPWEAQDWHYNRLSMLIQIAAYKKEPPKKQKVSDFRSRWQAANRANRERFGSTG